MPVRYREHVCYECRCKRPWGRYCGSQPPKGNPAGFLEVTVGVERLWMNWRPVSRSAPTLNKDVIAILMNVLQ